MLQSVGGFCLKPFSKTRNYLQPIKSGENVTLPNPIPETRASMLWRIRDPQDQEAWRAFVEVYAPVIDGFARKKGLNNADAADVVQRVLIEVVGSIPKFEYDRARGKFRSWLFTLTRFQLARFFDSQNKAVLGTGDSAMQAQLQNSPTDDPLEKLWDDQYESQLFQWAAAKVQAEIDVKTWQAFWLAAVEGLPAKQISEEVGISQGAVWIAKSRVIRRLKDAIARFEGEPE